jgi:hypothetical protein
VSAKVDKVDTKLDGHITWHLETKWKSKSIPKLLCPQWKKAKK